MGPGLDNDTIRQLTPSELALYFRRASQDRNTSLLAVDLLRSIEQETLPPTVFAVFSTSIDPPCPLFDALWQQHSKYVRRVAIQSLGRAMRSPDWTAAWEDVGGTQGLLSLFARLSVKEVKELSRAIGRCKGRSTIHAEERKLRVTELVKCLLPSIYPNSAHQTSDQRQLQHHYAHMVPACTSDFVEKLLCEETHPLFEALPIKPVATYHVQSIRRLVLDGICHKISVDHSVLTRYLPLLSQSVPSISGPKPGISASMAFATAVIKSLATREETVLPESLFLPFVMLPLMRRLKSHKVDLEQVRSTVNFAIQYLKGKSRVRSLLSITDNSLLSYVAYFWSLDMKLFEKQLSTLLHMANHSSRIILSSYPRLLRSVKKSARYSLLRLICLSSTDASIDIDTLEGLKVIPDGTWPMCIFDTLQRDHGLSLLKRLMALNPKGSFLELSWDGSNFSRATAQGTRFADASIYLTQLQQDTADSESQSGAVIQSAKEKVAKSREQTDRASSVLVVFFHAIASGSLDIFKEVILWMRRFQRDPKTVATVFTDSVWSTPECISLLGGIPRNLKNINAAHIGERIRRANGIILDLLQSAVHSLREPSFRRSDWIAALSLCREVVKSRMLQAGRLKRALAMTEHELYETLWANTLTTLLRAEEVGLEPEHQSLGFNIPHGPLAFPISVATELVNPPLPSSFRFLDNMARSRDKLWQVFRTKTEPAVAALDRPWPKGLPIQCLAGPYAVATESAQNHTSFIACRAGEVVMSEPERVLQEVNIDEEMEKAIGPFIDNWKSALAIYVMQNPSGQDRETSFSAASLHAIRHLSRESMSESEAKAFWRSVFREALPLIKLPDLEADLPKEFPVVPRDIEAVELTEWNPNPFSTSKTDSRKLAATILDCMLSAPQGAQWPQWGFKDKFILPELRTKRIDPLPIWSRERLADLRDLSPSVQEGLGLSALLLQASEIEGASKILNSPFPSVENMRYPALFLDEDFLRDAEGLRPPPINVLSHIIELVPSTLLCSLVKVALDVLSGTPSDSKKIASTERTAYKILKLLSKSDRPDLALPFITRTILNRTEASSWHRQLLTRNFVRSLGANHAQDLIESFASEMHTRLDQQAIQSKARVDADAAKSYSKPLIKVTTVKFLAQFLDDADFVAPQLTLNVLARVFQKTTHVDVRVAVVHTLLGKLARFTDKTPGDIVDKVMQTLQDTIPVLGSLNERHVVEETDRDREIGKLPEIYNDSDIKAPAPIFNLILQAITQHRVQDRMLSERLIESVLLPAIELSQSENANWVRDFILKYWPERVSTTPPIFPVKPAVLTSLIHFCYSEGKIPETTLDLYHQFVVVNISPSPFLAVLNQKMSEDIVLRESNEGLHWLSLYGQGPNVEFSILPTLLTKEWSSSTVAKRTKLAHVQDLVVREAMALLELEEVSFAHWNRFMAVLAPPSFRIGKEDQDIWLENARPVIQRIIDNIESLRTAEWQRSKDRKPAMLPDLYDYQLWLWPYPHFNRSTSLSRGSSWQDERCASFGATVKLALSGPQGVANHGLAHHRKLKSIELAALRCSPDDRLYLAWFIGPNTLELGDVEDGSEAKEHATENVLRADLAHALLREAKLRPSRGEGSIESGKVEFRGRDSIFDMLNGWRGCEIEEVRMRGFQLWEHFGL